MLGHQVRQPPAGDLRTTSTTAARSGCRARPSRFSSTTSSRRSTPRRGRRSTTTSRGMATRWPGAASALNDTIAALPSLLGHLQPVAHYLSAALDRADALHRLAQPVHERDRAGGAYQHFAAAQRRDDLRTPWIAIPTRSSRRSPRRRRRCRWVPTRWPRSGPSSPTSPPWAAICPRPPGRCGPPCRSSTRPSSRARGSSAARRRWTGSSSRSWSRSRTWPRRRGPIWPSTRSAPRSPRSTR